MKNTAQYFRNLIRYPYFYRLHWLCYGMLAYAALLLTGLRLLGLL